MTLADLGYNVDLKNHRIEQGLDSFGVGRVISEHKERYIVGCSDILVGTPNMLCTQ